MRNGIFITSEEYNAFYQRIKDDAPGWDDAFVKYIRRYYDAEPVGGSLHIVLDDLNWERHHITWCAGYACGKEDGFGNDLASLMLAMSDAQLQRVADRYQEW